MYLTFGLAALLWPGLTFGVLLLAVSVNMWRHRPGTTPATISERAG